MLNETNEVNNATMTNNCFIWIMDDESSDKLLAIIQAHLRLVKEHLCYDTLPERKQAIRSEIERLRAERELILAEVQCQSRPQRTATS